MKNAFNKHPALKYLLVVLKYFLKQRNMDNTTNNGLSGYSLFLMIFSFLQNHPSNFDVDIANNTSLGELLVGFFEIYGIYFNYEDLKIDVRKNGGYFKKEMTDFINCSKNGLYIIDPVNKESNAGFGTKDVNRIKRLFKSAYGCLISNDLPCASSLSKIIFFSGDLIERRKSLDNYYMYKRKSEDNQGFSKKQKY
jgi:non-canonical poly(A) RNA polymerase PAPD5/7